MTLSKFKELLKQYPMFEMDCMYNEVALLLKGYGDFYFAKYDIKENMFYIAPNLDWKLDRDYIEPLTLSGDVAHNYSQYKMFKNPTNKTFIRELNNLVKNFKDVLVKRKLNEIEQDFE